MIDDDRPIGILIVEDNPGDVDLLRENFKDFKPANKLHVAKDGVEALQYLRRQGSFSEAALPDLIILDLNLPRKNGYEVLAEIKNASDLKRIPLVIFSSSQADENIMKFCASPAVCYLNKPERLDDFAKLLQAIEAFWINSMKLGT